MVKCETRSKISFLFQKTPSTFTGFEYQQQYQTMTHQPPPGWQQQQMEQSSSNKFKKIEGKGAASTINKPNVSCEKSIVL